MKVFGSIPSLKEKEADLNSVMNGLEGSVMVAFKDSLTDQQTADVINYINHSWGNEFNEIDANEVLKMR